MSALSGDDVANAETETVNAGDNGDLNVEDAVSAKIKVQMLIMIWQ